RRRRARLGPAVPRRPLAGVSRGQHEQALDHARPARPRGGGVAHRVRRGCRCARPEPPARRDRELGLGPETLLAKNPRLVYCSLWTFGTSGPLRLRPGYEPMVQAFAGLMMVNGEEGGPPMRMGTSVLDSGTGMWAAIGVLAALVERQRTGRGSIVDTSLFETGLGWLANHFASYRISGNPPLRHRTGS